jgi:hypothetical protein
MAIGDNYIAYIGVVSAYTPEVNDTLAADDGEGNPIDPTFLITAIEEVEPDFEWNVTVIQQTNGTLPNIGDFLIGDGGLYEVLGEFTSGYVFSPPNDIVTIRRLVVAAGNKIYYENV